MELSQAIQRWDGKSTDDIAEIYTRHHASQDFTTQLLDCLLSPTLQVGASWLLKKWLEDGHALTGLQVAVIFRSLAKLEHWQSCLHLLQCLDRLPIGEPDKLLVEQFLRENLNHSNKFVRAWSYNGFYVLARQHPEYRAETAQFFAMALRDEAPSVVARIRNLMKQGF